MFEIGIFQAKPNLPTMFRTFRAAFPLSDLSLRGFRFLPLRLHVLLRAMRSTEEEKAWDCRLHQDSHENLRPGGRGRKVVVTKTVGSIADGNALLVHCRLLGRGPGVWVRNITEATFWVMSQPGL